MTIATENMTKAIDALTAYRNALMVMAPDNLRSNMTWAKNHENPEMRGLTEMIADVARLRNIEPDSDIWAHCMIYHIETCQTSGGCAAPFVKP